MSNSRTSHGWRRALPLIVGAALAIAASLPDRTSAAAQGATVCNPANFNIAIDVGHTPEAPGTTSARGVAEHAYNLQLSNEIKRALLEGGYSRVTLITARGIGRTQLLARVKRANALNVDLLLSVHHDDVQDFYHAKWNYNGVTRAFSDKFSGYSLFVSRQNQHFERSLTFAKLLGTALMEQGLRYSAHHAEAIPGEGRQLIDSKAGVYLYDNLVVLKFTKAPAVLLEAGVIVNRIEELVLASAEGRAHISTAVLEAVSQFCRERPL